VAQQLAIVTGASSGIGRATAQALGALGWRVVLVARRRDELEEVATSIRAVGVGSAVVEPLDLADPDAVAAMSERVRSTHGTPGAIVHAAGVGAWRWLEETPPEEMASMLDAPFRSAYHVTYGFLGAMLAAGEGVIVHVGSPASIVAWPSATAYVASRWALRGLHEALVQDLHGTGVRSCHVMFGPVSSAYWDTNVGSHERRPRLGDVLPRITPGEAAEVIVRTIHQPREQVLHPRTLTLLGTVHRLAPGTVRRLVRRSGPRR
jgi:uncharacterized protein